MLLVLVVQVPNLLEEAFLMFMFTVCGKDTAML
jgi:hypothetical protein